MDTRITRLLGIQYPIFQGAMARIADGRLAGSVSEAGGLGIIACGGAPLDWVRQQVQIARSITSKPLGANVMLMDPKADDLAKLLVELDVDVITTGAGSPANYISMWKEAGIKVVPVVASAALAARMERLGADAVVAEGTEAGGHIGELTTFALVPSVCQAVKIPVVAAGGVVDGRGMLAAFALGAEGVQCGTRFLTVEECGVAEAYKERILKAKDSDTIVTGRGTGHPVRGLKNRFSRNCRKIEAAAQSPDELEGLYAGSLRRAVEGDVDNGSLMAGQVACLVHERKTCADVLQEMVGEAQSLGGWTLAQMADANSRRQRALAASAATPTAPTAADVVGETAAVVETADATEVALAAPAFDPRLPVFMLSGQGAQKPGMGCGLTQIPQVAAALECGSQVFGRDLTYLVTQASAEELGSTLNAQAALAALSLGLSRALMDQGVRPGAVLGFSLGQIPALAVSGMLSDQAMFQLLRKRAELMDQAAQARPGAMSALLKAEEASVDELCRACAQDQVLVPANFNCPGQIVISGDQEAVARAEQAWAEGGKRFARLATAGGFHSPLMQQAATEFAAYLEDVGFAQPQIPLICNVNAQPLTPSQAKEQLAAHLVSPVRFSQSVSLLKDAGFTRFTEVGFGGTLSNLVKRVDRGLERACVQDAESLEAEVAFRKTRDERSA